jgi:hypothetical protein
MVLLIVTWVLIGLIVGAASYVLIPWTLAMLGGRAASSAVGRYYIKQMQTVLGDSTLVARQQGGVSLASVSFDADFEADRLKVAGETGHLTDSLNVKSRLAGQGFGIGLESHAVYISPLFAEFAEFAEKAHDRGRLRPDAETPRFDFEMPEMPTVPDLRKTTRVLDDDAGRRFGVLAESWTQKSQEKFGRRISIGQTLILIGAFGVGSGMAILAMRYGGAGGGGGGTTIPIMLGVLG